jgi:hypothetical protein
MVPSSSHCDDEADHARLVVEWLSDVEHAQLDPVSPLLAANKSVFEDEPHVPARYDGTDAAGHFIKAVALVTPHNVIRRSKKR